MLQMAKTAIRACRDQEEHAAADLVGDQARGHDRAGADEGAGALDHQELARRALGEQGDPANREHGHEVEQREARQRDQARRPGERAHGSGSAG